MGAWLSAVLSNLQVRLSATATNEASATTAVVARMLAVILNARATLAWSVASHVVDTVVIAARNALIGLPPGRRISDAMPLLDDPDPSESSSIIVPSGPRFSDGLAARLPKLIPTVFKM